MNYFINLIFYLFIFILLINCEDKITLIATNLNENKNYYFNYNINSSSSSSLNYYDIYKSIQEYCNLQIISSSSSSFNSRKEINSFKKDKKKKKENQNQNENCQILLLSELLKLFSINFNTQSPWLIDDVVRHTFTFDLIEAVCKSELGKRYSSYKKCSKKVKNHVQTKKSWLAQYDVLKLRSNMLNSDKIILENWSDTIEGHSFAFYQKIRTLSSYADDPRVSTICEIGFNFGHSVSIFLNLSFLYHKYFVFLFLFFKDLELVNFKS